MSASNSRLGRLETLRIVLVLCSLVMADTALAQSATTRVSVGPGGAQGNGASVYPAISADGRWVAFYSSASTLVANDTNGVSDVFVRDRQTGTTTRVSVGPGGIQGNADSSEVAISADGRWVAFESWASNLVAGDSNGRQDIFVHDQQTGSTTRVSVGTGNIQGDDNSWVPAISADGRWVTFDSWATTLVVGDTNATADIFVHDLYTGMTARVSVGPGGAQTSDPSYRPAISADGRWVAFGSYASTLVPNDTNGVADIFLHDQHTGTTTLVSVGPADVQGNADSWDASISDNGRWVAFSSWAANLVAGDTNVRADAFVYDRETGSTTRVSVGPDGVQGNDNTYDPMISADGNLVAFGSYATTLVSNDTGLSDVFVHDRQTGTTTRVNMGPGGTQGNSNSYWPTISADGRSVAFFSFANNLVAGDTNNVEDVFVTDRAGTIAGAVTNAATLAPVSNAFVAAVLSNGEIVASTFTNAQGAYTLPAVLQTGSYYVMAFPLSSTGLVAQLYKDIPCPSGVCQRTSGTAVAVTVPNATVNIDFALLPTPEPGPFSKVSPAQFATGVRVNPTLSWGASYGATSYEYCYDTSNDGACALWASTGTSTMVSLSGLKPRTNYYWHVRALNANGTTYAQANASAFWNFFTRYSPNVDLNGDGSGDALIYDPATGSWSRQISQIGGGFSEQSNGGWAPGWTVLPGDFNSDTLTDVFLHNASSGQWFKLFNVGGDYTTGSTGYWWPGWQKFVLDLNGDSVSDLFLYDLGTGHWFKAISTPSGFTYYDGWWSPGWEVTPMNLNGDAFGDLFLINRITGQWFWVFGQTGGGFTYPKVGYWAPDWALYPGDFNGDGLGDLFLYRPDAGEHYVAINNGAGYTYTAGYGWTAGWTPYVGDFDGNGVDDLFLYSAATGVWFQMISDGVGGFSVGGNQTWTTGWQLYPTDLNGDGRTDLLLYDPASGLWYQARNLVTGSFSYSSGTWATGLTIITRAPIR